INIGGPGVVKADGKTLPLDRLDCVYLPMGTKSVTFESNDAKEPARFYFLSCPAHAAHPIAVMKRSEATPVALGTQATEPADHPQIHSHGRHPELPVGDGIHRTRRGKRLEHIPSAHTQSQDGDIFLFRSWR